MEDYEMKIDLCIRNSMILRIENIYNICEWKNSFIVAVQIILWGIILFSSIGCEQISSPESIFDNPVDTLSSSFLKPATIILSGPTQGQTVAASTISFTWQGNKDIKDYSYSYDAVGWSAWNYQTTVTLEYLDEGSHFFSVRARHRNEVTIEDSPPKIYYVVDAVKGPSAMFFPRRIFINAGTTFNYDVYAEEVNSLYGASLTINYNPAIIQIDTIHAGSLIGGNAILLPTINNTAGTAIIDIATVGRRPKGVSGSGSLFILYCHALLAGTADLTFSRGECIYRDTTNTSINILDLVSGKVVVR
jgi:hypothetical protein